MLLTNYKHTQPTLGLSVTFVFIIELGLLKDIIGTRPTFTCSLNMNIRYMSDNFINGELFSLSNTYTLN